HSAHQHRTVGERRFRNVIEPCRIGDAGPDSDCAHRFLLNYTESSLYTSLDDTLCPAEAKSSDQVRIAAPALTTSAAENGHEMDPIGRKRWAIAEGYIPSQSARSD